MGRREGFPGEAALRLRRTTRRMKKEMEVGVERVRVHGQRGWKGAGSLGQLRGRIGGSHGGVLSRKTAGKALK